MDRTEVRRKQAVANRVAGNAGMAVGILGGLGLGLSLVKRDDDVGRYAAVSQAGLGGAAVGSALALALTSPACRACRIGAVSLGAAGGAALGAWAGYLATNQTGWPRPTTAGVGLLALTGGVLTSVIILLQEKLE
jgi:hypothetical protein